MDIQDSTVIVTGAGSGIGRSLVLKFADAGANVVCVGRRKDRLDQTVTMIKNKQASGLAIPADITSRDQVRNMVRTTLSHFGTIDILFNNAGSFQAIAPVNQADPQTWWNDVTVNLFGSFLTTREVLPVMIKRDHGIIINMNGGRPPGGTGYACGKAGLMELTRILTQELKSQQSSVMVFSAGPGLVHTEMTDLQLKTDAGRKWIPSTQESYQEGKMRSPDDIACKTVTLVQRAEPDWSGKHYGPDTDFDNF